MKHKIYYIFDKSREYKRTTSMIQPVLLTVSQEINWRNERERRAVSLLLELFCKDFLKERQFRIQLRFFRLVASSLDI